MNNRTFATVSFAVVSALAAPAAFGCMCMSWSRPCEEYWRTDAVFVGRVLRMDPSSIAEVERRNPKTVEEIPKQRVYLRVPEPFRGTSEPEVEIITDFSSCGVHFEQGTSYLVYAWRNNETGKLTTGACSGTAKMESKPKELEYLRGLVTGATKGEVFGFATQDPTDMVLPFRASKPIAGASVILRSRDRTWKTNTNDKGEYSFLGLEADRYEISVDLPNAPVAQSMRSFELTGQTCSRQNFLGTRVGKISGRLLDSEGVPIKGLLVDLVALPPTPQPRPIFWPQSEDDGRFEYPRLEAGEYILGVNLNEPANKRGWYGKRVPYTRSYYPGVTDRDRARVLKLEPGKSLEGIEFRLPPTPAAVTFRGKVIARRSRDRTVVALIDPEFSKEKSQVDAVMVAADGRFELTGVEGRRYILVAHSENAVIGRRHLHSPIVDLLPGAQEPVELSLSDDVPEDDCEVCKRFSIHLSPLWDETKKPHKN